MAHVPTYDPDEDKRPLIEQAYDIMRSYSGGPCEPGCLHDDCFEYRRVQAALGEAVRQREEIGLTLKTCVGCKEKTDILGDDGYCCQYCRSENS